MCKPNEEMVSEETFGEWLRTIFSLCYEGDLEELFGEEAGDEDLIDYVVDYYAAGLYPKIFEHFEYKPYMSGHDECGEFFEHSYLYGDVFELDYQMSESCLDGTSEYDLYDVYYLVSTGEIVHCMSFHFKSQLVEFTHEYLVSEAKEGEDCLDACNVCQAFDAIINGEVQNNG